MIPTALEKAPSLKLLLGLYVPAGAMLLAVWLLCIYTDTPVALYTRDPADITGTSPFLGVLSNVCILLWCATAAICFFASAVLKGQDKLRMAVFFLLAGLVTGMLLLDDLFLLHERVFPELFHWRQRYIYLAYAALVTGYLVLFRKIVWRSHPLLLALALCFFGLSLAVDGLAAKGAGPIPLHHLYEDGCKLFGLVGWLGYFGRTALLAVGLPAARKGQGTSHHTHAEDGAP